MRKAWGNIRNIVHRQASERIRPAEMRLYKKHAYAWLDWDLVEEVARMEQRMVIAPDAATEWVIPMIHALERRQMVALSDHITHSVLKQDHELTPLREHMAHYTKGLFVEGEIDFPQFIERLRHLYPDAMSSLPPELKGKIAGLGERKMH